MSFILDALKKAESERNRRVAPVLMDARVAVPRRGLPLWVWVLGAILVVNLGVLAWLLLRDKSPPQLAAIAPVPTAVPAPVPVPAGAGATPGAIPNAASPGSPADAGIATNSQGVPVPAPPAASSTQTVPGIVAIVPSNTPRTAEPATIDANDLPAVDASALPTADELRARGVSLPALELNLHIYNAAPASRSVLLNGQRVREGDFTPNGVKLERITPEGVVLEAAGRRFRVDAGG